MYVYLISCVVLTFIGSCIQPVENARILALTIVGGKSHWNFMSEVLKVLTDNGHSVTVFTPFLDGNRENYTEVDLSKEYSVIIDVKLIELMKAYGSATATLDIYMHLSRRQCNTLFANSKLKEILKNGPQSNFDLVLIEPLASTCVSYPAIKLNLPLIYVEPMTFACYSERTTTGHPSNPAVVSHVMAHHAVPRTFIQRLTNTAISVYSIIVTGYQELLLKYTDPKEYDLYTPIPPSLVFTNGHYISDAPRPLPTNVINVGGIHLKPPKKIPKDILKYIEESSNGVIYFSFGSTVKMSSLEKYIINAFKDALGQVPQRVLWKYEGEMEDKPKNVMTKEWFPQRDILAHPNVKLFISHGGVSGLYEAVDAGVPVLGFPLFGDQPRNIANLVDNGMSISMDLISVTKENILENILELVNEKKYLNNAKIASEIFNDRPISSTQSVIYWTNYVLRHKGAPHLRSHALNLTWYQYFLLDIIAVFLIFISLVIFILRRVFKCIYEYAFKNFQNVKLKSK